MGAEQIEVSTFRDVVATQFEATEAQLRTVDELLALYRQRLLVDEDRALPLHHSCPRCEVCWQTSKELAPQHAEHQGVSIPWIGREYDRSRVLILGTNLHDYGGLAAHWWLCEGYAREQHEGHRGKGSLTFGHGAAAYAHAVISALDGEPLAADDGFPEPTEVAYVWSRCAFLEAIKCAPLTRRSTPLPSMYRECPEYLLLAELTILRPRAVVVLGRSSLRDHIRPLFESHGLEWGGHPGSMEWDSFELEGERVALFSLNHPSSANPAYWQDRSFPQLVEALPTALEGPR